MAFTALTHRADALGNDGGTTGAIDTSGADLLVLAVATEIGVTLVAGDISDNKSNVTWVLAGNATYGSATHRLHVFLHASPAVGSGHTFTVTKTSSFCSAAVASFSGAHASPFDQESGANASGTIAPASSLTPSVNDCLVISALALQTATTLTVPSGFTSLDEVAFGSQFGIAMAYRIQTTATATQPAWDSTNGSQITEAVIFKPATGGGGSAFPAHYYQMMRQ